MWRNSYLCGVSIYRYFIELAFDGTAFHGWQVQDNAHTVQAELNRCMELVLREKVETIGCGRTDTGVHAKQLYVHFDISRLLNDSDLRRVNALLPFSIVTKRLVVVDNGAHARFDAILRSYEYFIHFEKNPFLVNKSWWLKNGAILNVELMNVAAERLFLYRDFSCFSKTNTQTLTNNCKIIAAEWTRTEEGLVFKISADRFLRNMVRAIVGTLLEVGFGRLALEDIDKIVESKKRSEAGVSVPACGLYLSEVKYPYL